ncbi:MAG: GNAT family N-acetyltransferase [Candidatus Obscuribacterales bacterium]|nr:GNAT family N-acetyltransferase [Candidatus Obscuribacterales bacterium]
MTLKKFEIVEFDSRYQEAIERLVLPIQQVEFGVKITRDEQPDLTNIQSVFQTGNGNFWIALSNGKVVGTIGVVDIGDQMVALKKMFVDKEYRGKQAGVAQSLMDTAKRWCVEKNLCTVLLGTTAQMSAAHRFYEKNGFVEVAMDKLPSNFPIVHVDTKFYRLDLSPPQDSTIGP